MDYQFAEFDGFELSIAMAGSLDKQLVSHLRKPGYQEDLTFAYWRPSRGATRYTAVLFKLNLPISGERILQGNVAFTAEYLARVMKEKPDGAGIALIHSHLGPGWQDMSDDDIVAERDRLGGLVASTTLLPVVGLTWGTDGTWSGRFWLRSGRHSYKIRWAETVRSVGASLRVSYHPTLRAQESPSASQVATVSVWGQAAQGNLSRVHVGIVGLGSVGSILAEALSRTGIGRVTLIDHDLLEERNLDRTLGAFPSDADQKIAKVKISQRLISQTHTATTFRVESVVAHIQDSDGFAKALDCDVLMSCVDRPWPRHVLNAISYAHLIPIIDGGIFARVSNGHLQHVDWRIHTAGPDRACLYCLQALVRSDVSLDKDGQLDDPDYIKGLTAEERERYARRNVFAFSLSVAAHQVLQLVTLVTGNARIGGIGPQIYHGYPGVMTPSDQTICDSECDVSGLTALAHMNIV